MISFRNLGRLGYFGNRLFQYAATRLYAELNGFSYSFPHWEGEELFGLPPARSRYSYLLPTVQLDDLRATSWHERLLTPLGLWRRDSMDRLWRQPVNHINLYGYLQDEATLAMLRTHRSTIQSWFTLINPIEDELREKAGHDPWISVHVRRGDMVKRDMATHTQEPLTLAQQLAHGRKIFVASDDPTIASPSPSSTRISPMVADFWMMMRSETLIGSGSTFAWWAAFIGQSEYWSPPLNRTWGTSRPSIELRSP